MGTKGGGGRTSWFSAIKGVFTSTSKHNHNHNPTTPLSLVNNIKAKILLQKQQQQEGEKKSRKEKKGTRLKHGFPRLFREPSSIEKILGEVDQHNLYFSHPNPPPTSTQPQPSSSSSGRPVSPPPPPSPRVVHSPRVTASPLEAANSPLQTTFTPSPRGIIHPQTTEIISHTSQPQPQPQPTLQHHHLSASRIQAAYRRYKSRRNLRGFTDRLVRLQGVVKGQNVKRQTVNTMKQMQLLVKVQTQIHSRRIQMLDNQPLKPPSSNNDNNLSEMGDWDDSVITKEEREARLKKKAEGVTKRERAMSYAYSHQKATPKSGHEKDIRIGGYPLYPWWWNSLEHQLPSHTPPTQPPLKNHQLASTPSGLTPDRKQSLRSHKQLDSLATPMSSKSVAPSRTRQQTTPSSTPPNRMMMLKYPKSRARGGYPMKDDDSLMSCPPFSVPNYMSPTISAKAKARPTSNPRDRVTPSTPGSMSLSLSKRRFSFPFTPNSNKWNKRNSPRSVGDFSVDSGISVPASLGRKPFNRFV